MKIEALKPESMIRTNFHKAGQISTQDQLNPLIYSQSQTSNLAQKNSNFKLHQSNDNQTKIFKINTHSNSFVFERPLKYFISSINKHPLQFGQDSKQNINSIKPQVIMMKNGKVIESFYLADSIIENLDQSQDQLRWQDIDFEDEQNYDYFFE